MRNWNWHKIHQGISRIWSSLILGSLLVVLLGSNSSFAETEIILTVQDGMDAANNQTLTTAGYDTNLNTDDDGEDVPVGKGTDFADNQWIGIKFTTGTIPAGDSLTSVVIEFERKMDGTNKKTGTLFMDVSDSTSTTLWSDSTRGNETGQGTNEQSFALVGTANFVPETYDVSSIITTVQKLRDMEVNFRNLTSSFKDVYLDYVRVRVNYTDDTAPAAVNDLATGDNGSAGTLISGSSFAIQYATDPGATWLASSAQVEIATSNVAAGAAQYTTVSLDANTTYYFKMWTYDEVGNLSTVSNQASTCTLSNAVTGS
jgi:hypothetical protein